MVRNEEPLFRLPNLDGEHPSEDATIQVIDAYLDMLGAKHVGAPPRRIPPRQVFSFTDMSAAFRLLGSGNHIDKLAVSDGEGSRISLPMRHAPRTMGIQSSECHLIVSGLKGLCASLAVHTAKNGDKYLAVFSRSGYNDEASQEVCPKHTDLGYEIDLLAGDVTVLKDETPHALMTVDEYHAALECKVRGSWHLHDTTIEMGLALDFLIMLSSISGLYGGKSPANYAAGNTFLNAFSAYRRNLRL
ncbi:hypothetical protein S7711_08493 [Stachybotrys chartarum IBT 7711]|uniref:Ketoreductase domain-containing protein n=1 Tax=Stachybotrys chartarum (strain CBS 109288 / IBT 7711) TaxID=1280523 RepID=A0A084BCP5_STACB|nr:hypothetical protein S7711_08493 [Stachybotrys chartarum IBT 7711]